MDRLMLAKTYRARYEAGETYQDLVDEYNLLYRRNQRPYTRGFIASLFRDLSDDMTPPPMPENIIELDNWQGVTNRSQVGAFKDALAKLERDKRYINLEHDNDNHFPYQDNDAQNLRSLCRQVLQPDIIVGGSDAIDAPTISRFERDPRIPSGRVLTRFRDHWQYHVNNRYQYDAPDAIKVWIKGNHDERVWNHLMASEDYDVLYDYHVDTITQNGLVFWLGTGQESLSVIVADTLMVTHGTKATVHTANGMLRLYDNQYSILAGHSHRPDYYTTRSKYMVSAVIGGCGCDLYPHHEKRRVISNWQHGYSYAVVDTRTQTAITKLVNFVHTPDSIWCVLDNEVLSVKKQVAIGQAA